ncbi:MAG: phenylalanine--tRNA ligase subunit alpha [Thermoproteota archaeon]|nr:phenylalanine--tRNA ligase subunit alpha [Thermoproteota archaeon]
MQDNRSQLHPIEKSLLKTLADNHQMTVEVLSQITGFNIDQVRRGIEWLKHKNLVLIKDKSTVKISLGKNGQDAIDKGLPERRLVDLVKNGFNTMRKLGHAGIFGENELGAAYRYAVHVNKWLAQGPPSTEDGEPRLVVLPGSDKESAEETLMKKIRANSAISKDQLGQTESKAFDSLKKRRFVVEDKEKSSEITLSDKGRQLFEHQNLRYEGRETKTAEETVNQLTSQLITSGGWKNVRLTTLDVEAPAPTIYAGKKHPLQNLIDEIKEVFIGMGFLEIEGPFIQTSFWNFDVLFTPQDHPAREMQDTFYVPQIRQTLSTDDQQYIENVSRVHKNGWHYEWDLKEANRTVLRTHTTPVTIKYLADSKLQDARVFTVGRVFRNEKTSYKHLVEFNQIEGIVTGSNVTLRDLMGLQMEFYSKLGITKVKFWPTFFPYTEPSLQSMIYNETLEKWVELFGMGIFRPEVTEPLGIKNPVLAWGGGIERIAMLRFGLNDVRDLYANNLGWLRSVPRYRS